MNCPLCKRILVRNRKKDCSAESNKIFYCRKGPRSPGSIMGHYSKSIDIHNNIILEDFIMEKFIITLYENETIIENFDFELLLKLDTRLSNDKLNIDNVKKYILFS